MAVYYARKSGNVNATDVWSTTPTGAAGNFFPSFTNQDILMANDFTIAINVNTTVKEIRTDAAYGARELGNARFNMGAGVTLTADIYAGSQNACLDISVNSTVTIVGSVYGGYGGSAWAAVMIINANPTVNLIGNIFAGRTSQASGASIHSNSAGIINITGNVYGGRGSNALGLSVTGNGSAQANVTGNVFGGLNGTNAPGVGVSNAVFTLVGTAVGGFSAGISVGAGATASVSVTRAKGGPLLNSAVGIANSSSVSTVTVDEIEYGDLGASPTSGPIRFADKTSTAVFMYRETGSKKPLVDSSWSALVPAAANVRAGVAYNNGNTTGTCAIPALSSVLVGVPCDVGTGTASLSPADLWNHLAANATTSGSMGERLKNCATISSVGQSVAAAVGA